MARAIISPRISTLALCPVMFRPTAAATWYFWLSASLSLPFAFWSPAALPLLIPSFALSLTPGLPSFPFVPGVSTPMLFMTLVESVELESVLLSLLSLFLSSVSLTFLLVSVGFSSFLSLSPPSSPSFFFPKYSPERSLLAVSSVAFVPFANLFRYRSISAPIAVASASLLSRLNVSARKLALPAASRLPPMTVFTSELVILTVTLAPTAVDLPAAKELLLVTVLPS